MNQSCRIPQRGMQPIIVTTFNYHPFGVQANLPEEKLKWFGKKDVNREARLI